MAQNIAIEFLVKEKQKLVAEKDAAIAQFDNRISKLNTAIEQLSGKKVWEVEQEMVYDDENPEYIKQSIEN